VPVGPDHPVRSSRAALEDHEGMSFCVNDEVDDLVAEGWCGTGCGTVWSRGFPGPSPFEIGRV
jgi:hypothetical protein